MTETPAYDIENIRYHPWINGCLEAYRLVSLTIETDSMLPLMMWMIKDKYSTNSQMILRFDLLKKTIDGRSSDSVCPHTFNGPLKIIDQVVSVNLKWIEYGISHANLKIVHEILRKQKQLKIVINLDYEMIFNYHKEELFTCEAKMTKRIQFHDMNAEGKMAVQAKIEEPLQVDYFGDRGARNGNGGRQNRMTEG